MRSGPARTENLNVVVVDPGLMELGGHHAGLASSLADDIESGKKARLTFISHVELDRRLINRFKQSNIRLFTHFKTNFYDVMTASSSLSKLDKPIAYLAKEYESAFQLVSAMGAVGCVVLIPCIAWQHAIALNIAMIRLKANLGKQQALNFKIAACAMFNPGVSADYSVLDDALYFNNQLAFSWLKKHKECLVYASDFELSSVFHFLLRQDTAFPVHPSYLVNWSEFRTVIKQAKRDPNCIILYSGDAKKEKGFCELPNVISACLKSYPEKRLIVQYTVNWPMSELDSTIAELEKLSKAHSQICLHKDYWEVDTLLRYFAEASAIALLYNTSAYQNKSSGMLWLAAFAGLDVWVVGESWLTREAKRLGSEVYIFNVSSHVVKLTQLSQRCSLPSSYAETLFDDTWNWLETL